MSYEKVCWYLGVKIEVERRYPLRWGAPGVPRKKKVKPTPEQIEKQNEWQAVRSLNRIITANFSEEDFHAILTFRENISREEARKYLKRFLKMMRDIYKRAGELFKYITVTEYENKRIHHHIIINDYPGRDSDTVKLTKAMWKKAAGAKAGNPKFVGLYDNGDYKSLAEYLVKETKKTFREKDACMKKRWSCSRNLIRPEPVKETVPAKGWRKEPKIPKGYYLEPDSLINGMNPVTGLPYQHYTLVKLENPFEKPQRQNAEKREFY